MSNSLMGHINSKEEVIEAFRCFDKDNSGYLDAAVLRQILAELGDVMEDFEINDLVQHADFQRNGKIKYADFVNLLFMYDGK